MPKRKNKRKQITPRTELMLAAPLPLAKQMHNVHPIHGAFGLVFEELGGVERLVDWADENYDAFVRIFSKMIPPADANVPAAINIQINNQLGPTLLDN